MRRLFPLCRLMLAVLLLLLPLLVLCAPLAPLARLGLPLPLTQSTTLPTLHSVQLHFQTNNDANVNPDPSPHAVPLTRTTSSAVPESLRNFVKGWWVVAITVASTLPWAIVAVLDAIDASYRTAGVIALRLALASACLLLAYTIGLLFVAVLSAEPDGRYDEIATVLVLMLFNLWHIARNTRGWLQYVALRALHPFFSRLQSNLALSQPGRPSSAHVCVQGLQRLRVSNRLIDNDWNKETPFLSPFYRFHVPTSTVDLDKNISLSLPQPHFARTSHQSNHETPSNAHHYTREVWAVAAWRAWWTQDTSMPQCPSPDLSDPPSLDCRKENRQTLAEGLLSRPEGPQWPPDRDVLDTGSPGNPPITNRKQWARCLTTYGSEEGQQDTMGDSLPTVVNFSNASGVAAVVRDKTRYPPNRMSALWYNTARFQEVYEEKALEIHSMPELGAIIMPCWSSWMSIAQDIGTHLSRPIYLSDVHLTNFAGELAASSLIMARYPQKYSELVEQIYEDGLNARWTFGWSGLLACFSHLWTTERIHVAMLNGLSLLALSKTRCVSDIEENVRSMMYGYAAFAISDRAVGKKIAQERKAELLRRYREDKGKTCRGSGVCATRLACQWLGLPAEASHMDGLPAFATGWASEYMERKPGNQRPTHGTTHDEVETRHGSSNVWRYPHSHT